MQTKQTFKKALGGGLAVATLAGAGVIAQAPAASAASQWDQLAQCESGGNWSINTGNGYYGGLQFSQQSWQAVGGSGLPSQASKSEQISRAHQLWEAQGWGAWPSCSAQLGLSGNPGGGGSPAPAPEPEPEPAPVQQAPQQQAPAPAPAPEPAPVQQAPQTEVQSAPAPQSVEQPSSDVQVSGETYTVQSGDSLTSIAAALGVDWNELWSANGDLVEDPNLIFVGDQLKLPVAG
ncbi:transglycosylase family protein [Nesterenkonia sp. Act20]|uniref:LysM peptidoglycan-binding domain-containing protein n=1 Tax=Nesterenkonia sp. Act20 TaxID=1483432 RepID=UPI001C465501|nr:transglycosylase family protein [Nesterenkonia sp. Act20]